MTIRFRRETCPHCGGNNIGGSISGDRVVAWFCFVCKRTWQRNG